jgi:hypothetical protein
MKNVKVFFTALLLSLCLVSIRCTPDTTSVVSPTEEVLIRNIWVVDYFYYNQDMTNDFGGSRILFSSTGAVGYQRNGETIPGTWSKTVDALNDEVITLHFKTTDVNISRLNESWKLTNRTISSLQFEAINGTNSLFRIRTQ